MDTNLTTTNYATLCNDRTRACVNQTCQGEDEDHIRRFVSLSPPRRLSYAMPSSSRRMSTVRRRSMTMNSGRRLSIVGRRTISDHSPNSPLYLYRAPTHQIRIGLRSDRLSPGDTVEGTVVVYRDNAAGERVPQVVDVDVTLHCEVARRKVNHSYRSGQQFRPQDISPHRITRYSYTRTLVPHSHKWHAGPWEAQYHHTATPFRPVIQADMVPPAPRTPGSNGRVQCHAFSVDVPSDAPRSRAWNGNKLGAFVDIRYRVVAVARLSRPDAMLMAEAVFIVAPALPTSQPPMSVPRISLYGTPGVTSRASTTLSRRSLTLNVDRRSFAVGERDAIASVCMRLPKHKHAQVEVVERVTYNGKLRSETSVPCTPLEEENTWRLRTRGLCPDTVLGPLMVTHEVRATAGELRTSVRIRLTPGVGSAASSADDEIRPATRQLREQPPIHYYFQDELPLFGNLEYRAARAGGNANVQHRLCAAALAARLPRLTHAGPSSNDGDVCCLCLCDLSDEMLTRLSPCGHILHLNCAQKWLRHAASERRPVVNCPMCKQVLQ